MKTLTNILDFLINKMTDVLNYLNKEEITMSNPVYDSSGRYLLYFSKNNKQLDNYEVLKLIFYKLKNDKKFLEFGSRKIIFMSCFIDGKKTSFHHNVLITNSTTFQEYWNQIKDSITSNYKYGIFDGTFAIPRFEIRVWNLDMDSNRNIKGNTPTLDISISRNKPNVSLKRNIHLMVPKRLNGYRKTHLMSNVLSYVSPVFIPGLPVLTFFNPGFPILGINIPKFSRSVHTPLGGVIKDKKNEAFKPYAITPIKQKKFYDIEKLKLFSTMDIETITLRDFDNLQIPVVITSYTNVKLNKIFVIDHVKLKIAISNKDMDGIELLVKFLWKEYIDYILLTPKNFETIFVHNLGKFDGIFLYKGLLKNLDITKVNSIIDDKNNFISITYNTDKFKITWKDSLRIFPVSLDDLCKTFGVEGKTEKYNQEYNDISIFSPDNKELYNKFIEYSLQDSKALHNALLKAQEIYFLEHKVDITSIFSTSTLSLKIFRQKFLDRDIPIMSRNQDNFVRKSYYGGATDFYKAYGKKLFYYDVNSLYPYAMCKPMPLDFIKVHNKIENIDNFFGFIECIVTTSHDIKIPILPFKHLGKTIYPLGRWRATYFSEEIKAAIKYGYTFEFIKGYEYSKCNLFENYINYFYNIKKTSTGPQRFIAKMHLNQLYGYFGRKLDLIETINIRNEDLLFYVKTRLIKTMIDVDENITTLLLHSNLNPDLLAEINEDMEFELKSDMNSYVKSNVGIASAVTSYARIHMIPFKVNGDVYYTDTDSIFTATKLEDHLIGDEIGLMKDELNGFQIEEAYFLGIKQYGYYYINKNGTRIEQSVFCGVERNSLTFAEIKEIIEGNKINSKTKNRFFRSLKGLQMKIKPITITVFQNKTKTLNNNLYIPITIDKTLVKNNKLLYILRKIITIINQILKKK